MELAEYTQAQVDGMGHDEIAEALRRYQHPLLQAAADSIFYLAAQEGLLEEAQKAAERARTELADAKQPLDEQMARLNRRVIELTGQLDALRLNLPDSPLMFDAFGNRRDLAVRITLDGTHLICRPDEVDDQLDGCDDRSKYTFSDVYLSDEEIERLPEFEGW